MSTQRAMRVTITDARAVCEATGARQVVVIAFDGTGRFAVANHLASGTLPAPEGR